MATFVNSTFTGTNGTLLTAHTGELGATWTRNPNSLESVAPFIQSNSLQYGDGLGSHYYASGVPASADYTVSADIVTSTTVDATGVMGVGARLSTSVLTGYYATFFRSSNAARLYKYSAGTLTQIGSSVTFTQPISSTWRITIEVLGSAIKMRAQDQSSLLWLKPDGTSQSTQIDAITTTDTAITAAGRAGVWVGASGSGNPMLLDNFSASTFTALTISGPTSGAVGAPSSNFTVGADDTITGTVTVTPSDSGAGGTFTPTTVSISSGTPTATFTYTPASAGAKTISLTNSGGLSNPAGATYTASGGAATAVTLAGPTAGSVGAASSNFTAAANGDITGTVTVTPSDGGAGGTFTPTSVAISSGTPTATFTYTAASSGAKTISVTNSGGLSNPAGITYTASAGALYTVVDTTDTIGGQNIRVLIPAGGSSVPYNSANPTKVVLYVHGAGETQAALLDDALKAGCVNALLDAGYILAGSNARGNNWGTQVSADDYVALEKYVRDNYNVAGVCLWGQSMGGLNSLQVLAHGKFPVLGWLGTYPVVSLSNLYGLGTYAAAINTAHGITGSGIATYANRTRGLDPALFNGFAWKHIPMRVYASAGDTVVPKAANTDALVALVTDCTREVSLVACTGNHGDASHFVPAEYVAFFDRCFATRVALGRPSATRTATITLTTDGTTPAASLSGLKWSWWDQSTPNLGEYPTARGTVESTDASGVMTISVASNLSPGGIGWLVVTNSDGTTGQSPAAKAFSGPVAVA